MHKIPTLYGFVNENGDIARVHMYQNQAELSFIEDSSDDIRFKMQPILFLQLYEVGMLIENEFYGKLLRKYHYHLFKIGSVQYTSLEKEREPDIVTGLRGARNIVIGRDDINDRIRGYLGWLVNKLKKKIKEGKRIPVEQIIIATIADFLQKTESEKHPIDLPPLQIFNKKEEKVTNAAN